MYNTDIISPIMFFHGKLIVAWILYSNKDPSKQTFIDFEELLWGAAFMSHDCPHEPPFDEVRLWYIHRFYKQGKSEIEFQHLQNIAHDLLALKKLSNHERNVAEKEMDKVNKCMIQCEIIYKF